MEGKASKQTKLRQKRNTPPLYLDSKAFRCWRKGGGVKGTFTAVSQLSLQSYLREQLLPSFFSYRFHFIVSKQSHFSQESPLLRCTRHTNLVSSSGCLFLPEYFLHTFANCLTKTPFVIYLDMLEP